MNDQQTREPVRISVEDAKERYDVGNVTILDVIDSDVYNKFTYQIKSAVRITPEDIPDEYTRLPRDRAIFAY